ncbi:outer membrane protein assembly factor BamC [Vibrio algivorus]|uniref:Outer membrane protein assembly factor BamC n=1 Tax=Vibrio algivorus TaxID=1667024 RepID=A0A557PER2_9VIBR|nr:outer membrane protein assembly factor BamC [Vibrio algivorus]
MKSQHRITVSPQGKANQIKVKTLVLRGSQKVNLQVVERDSPRNVTRMSHAALSFLERAKRRSSNKPRETKNPLNCVILKSDEGAQFRISYDTLLTQLSLNAL